MRRVFALVALSAMGLALAACPEEAVSDFGAVPEGPGSPAITDPVPDATASDGASVDAALVPDTAVTSDVALPPCALDAVTWRNNQYEVVAKGKLWTLDGNRQLTGSPIGTDLRAFSGLRDGPCGSQASVCHLDALTWRPDLAMYYAVYGSRYWVLDGAFTFGDAGDGGAAGNLLETVAGVAAGPCLGIDAGTCAVEALAWRDDSKELFVVRDGKAWRLDGALALTTAAAGTSLTAIPGLVSMCGALGGNCPVDDFTWRDDVAQYHYFAGGRLWAVNISSTAVTGSGADLRNYAGFAAGPCSP